jgi:hypothetical protein
MTAVDLKLRVVTGEHARIRLPHQVNILDRILGELSAQTKIKCDFSRYVSTKAMHTSVPASGPESKDNCCMRYALWTQLKNTT